MEEKGIISKQIITFLIITSFIAAVFYVCGHFGSVAIFMWTPGISALLTSLIYEKKISGNNFDTK